MENPPVVTRRRLRLVAMAAALMVLASACGGETDTTDPPGNGDETSPTSPDQSPGDAEFTIRFSSIFGPTSGLQAQLDWFMDQVEERTNGRVEFERFYAASLLGAADTLSGIAERRTESGYMVPAYAPANLPLWNATFVPTEGANPEAIARAQAEMASTNEALAGELADAGIRMLVFNMIADLGTVATPDPITDVSQLDGLNVRALGYLANALQMRGVNPVVVEAQETYESIERGVINGAGGFAIDVLTAQGLQEVAPWMVKIDIGGWVGAGMAINADYYDALPDDIKQVMAEVADEFYDQAMEILVSVEESACDELIAAGGGVTVLPADQSAAWRDEIGDSLWALWRADAATSGATEEQIQSVEEDWRTLTASFAADSVYESGLDLCAARADLPG